MNHSSTVSSIVSRPKQERFLSIPQAPICYWLRERFFELLADRTLGEIAHVPCGPSLGDTARFVRFTWEVDVCQLPQTGGIKHKRWFPFDKGGGYAKWAGLDHWVVDWQDSGRRVKSAGLPGTYIRNESFLLMPGWTFSSMARGSLGVRKAGPGVWGLSWSGDIQAKRSP